MKLTEETIYLMEQLQILHSEYKKGDFKSFWIQYQFEVFYWSQVQRLGNLISQQIIKIKPFHNK